MDADKQRMKWRPGACENCGARGHRRKECFEKPRKVPAKFAKEPIAIPAEQPEEPIRREQLVDGGGSGTASYDAKRDRWSCYDPSDYREVEEEFEKMEEARRKLKAEQGEVVELVDTNDEDVYAEDMAPVQGVDMDSRTRITVRNLRIREDTAKYLFNLDPQGAYYDPKSRSMRENPFKNVIEPKWGMKPEDQLDHEEKKMLDCTFLGENYTRTTGEVVDATESQEFAERVQIRGLEVNPIADPTRLEILRRRFEEERKMKAAVKQEEGEEKGQEMS